MKLYNYWRSGTSHRVRIALELKGLKYEYNPVDLRKGEHKAAPYLDLNPQGLVPALDIGNGTILSQSPAIIEYLEERYPERPLLVAKAEHNARIRAMASMIGCDIHPMNNLRVLKYLTEELEQPENSRNNWIARWITDGFSALERIIARDSEHGRFCFADRPTLVECYLIPQIYSAKRFGVDLSPFPTLQEIDAAAHELEAFQRAHPSNQPDAE